LDSVFVTTIIEDVSSWIILLAAIASFYYALKLLLAMRKGQMQESWVYIAFAAFSGLLAMLVEVDLDNPVSDSIASVLGNFELVFMAISSVLLFLGFRAQLRIWRPKGFNKPIKDVLEIPDSPIKKQID
jgi:hypothetical protein